VAYKKITRSFVDKQIRVFVANKILAFVVYKKTRAFVAYEKIIRAFVAYEKPFVHLWQKELTIISGTIA
jgi:hypothetical protein